MRLILAAGMQRSGSTWLYNVARLILETNLGPKDVWSGWIDDVPPDLVQETALVKVHNFDPDLVAWADVVLYCYRDIRDVLASAYRVWDMPPTLDAAEALVDQFDHWMRSQSIVIRYDHMISQPGLMIERIAAILGYPADPLDIQRKLATLSYDSPGPRDKVHHRVNLFHPNHITDGKHDTWHDCIRPELVATIERNHSDWFARYSYLPLSQPDASAREVLPKTQSNLTE